MSLHTQNSSANRGACVQNCRRTYTVIDKETGDELEIDNEFIMSPKDLCTLDFLDQVVDTGIAVLKIEGRGRAPEYVKTVIETYRSTLDALARGQYTREKVEVWMADLETVYNRGFWSGYYLGQKLGEFHNTSGSKATQKKVYLGKGEHYFSKAGIGEFKIEAQTLRVNDKVLITGPTAGVVEHEITEMMVDDQKVEEAKRGDHVTFPIGVKVRNSDKLYKLVENEER